MAKKHHKTNSFSMTGLADWMRSYARWFAVGFAAFILLSLTVIFFLLIGLWNLIVRPVATWIPECSSQLQMTLDERQKIQTLEEKVQNLEQQLQKDAQR